MTSSPSDEPAGVQRPRIFTAPEFSSSAGDEAVELARLAGLHLDEWQQLVLRHALGEKPDGKWAAFEVGLVVSRQNGKGAILEARELAGLFLLGERLIIHSAHEFATSLEAFNRLRGLVEDNPDFSKRVKKIRNSHGEEGIDLQNGQRIRFRTRTKGGGLGFSCDCLILDEAMIIPESAHGALLPTLSARPNPQVWYTGTAVDQEIHEHGVVLARTRERGMKGDDSLVYCEWSAPDDLLEVDERLIADRERWAMANPGLGIRINHEHVALERASMSQRMFAVQRLCIGDWPVTDGSAEQVIPIETWDGLEDGSSGIEGPVCFAFDVTPDRSWCSIAAAGKRKDGLLHVETVDRRRGTEWVPERLAELVKAHKAKGVFCDAAGPAGSLLPRLTELKVQANPVSAREHAQACGLLFDVVTDQGNLRHLGTPELRVALKGAAKRPLGDAWAWSRKSSGVDISPLVAVTLALWGSMSQGDSQEMWFRWV